MAYFCDDCNEECGTEWVDLGIGPYEFWGARGNHTDYQEVSDCCGADFTHEDELELEEAV